MTCETADRLLGCGLVAILEEELSDQVGIHADGAVLARSQPRRGFRANEIGVGFAISVRRYLGLVPLHCFSDGTRLLLGRSRH
jgi:hypothetical protein